MKLLFEKKQNNRDYSFKSVFDLNMNKYGVNRVIKSIGGEFYVS